MALTALVGPVATAAEQPTHRSAGPELSPVAPLALTASAGPNSENGLSPAQIHAAYGLPARGARGQTIAIVSAYNDPHAQADLNSYDKNFGLPPCTAKNGCLRQVNQEGKTSPLPGQDATGGIWNTESALGIEVVHGTCQSCRIVLLEANTATVPDFAAASNTAALLGANVVVTTFTPPDSPAYSTYADDFTHARTAVVAATGDTGYTGLAPFPSAFPNVLAVGGTELQLSKAGGYGSEQAWVDYSKTGEIINATVSGCAFSEQAAPWELQASRRGDCGTKRAVADLSAVAQPGAIVHITGSGTPGGPWYTATGTSFSAPVIAGIVGLAGSVGNGESRMLYQHAASEVGALHDITRGQNSPVCVSPICKAGRGWDGPTGLGTPDGLAVFLRSGGALARNDPRITISVPKNRLSLNSRWSGHVSITNNNPVAVRGSLVIRSLVRIGAELRSITLGSAKLSLAPLDHVSQRLVVTHWRSVVKQRGTLRVSIHLDVHGPAGGAVTVTKKSIELLAP